jgi:glycolate oxidase iron-sulfur subunit
MLALAPSRLPAPDRTGGSAFPAEGAVKGRVALMPGCAQSVLDPGINAAAIRLLTRHGRAVAVLPQGQCCGALPRHMGRTAAARALARPVIRALLAEPGLDALVVTTSGCGSVIKDYAALFRGEAGEAEARRAAALARDLSELLDPAELKPTRPPLRVAYHAACSLQHGQKVTSQPVALLQAAGAMPLIPRDAHLCCGSAGTYNLLQPAIAGELARRKAAALAELSPQVIVTGNIGCMTQIGAAQAVPVIHLAEYLDWATGGPVPAKIAHLATEAPE